MHEADQPATCSCRTCTAANGAPNSVSYSCSQDLFSSRQRIDLAIICVLACAARFFVGSPDHGGGNIAPTSHAHTEAHPSGVVGFCKGTCSSTLERETALSELESQMKRSRKRSSFSFNGLRTVICSSVSKLAPSTPTAKKESALASSPACTILAASFQASVGAPSVTRKIHGR